MMNAGIVLTTKRAKLPTPSNSPSFCILTSLWAGGYLSNPPLAYLGDVNLSSIPTIVKSTIKTAKIAGFITFLFSCLETKLVAFVLSPFMATFVPIIDTFDIHLITCCFLPFEDPFLFS